jgi:5-methyltetrahydropteroyltriglutamate--homocysteine methyltransferase
VQTTIIGALPKLPVRYEEADNIRRALNAFEAGRIGVSDLETTQARTQARALAWQAEAGIDLPGDGQTRWQDLLSPLCLDLSGMEAGGLIRFFNNNTYYRHPVIGGRVALEGRTLPGWFGQAKALAAGPLKASLPGPFTVARLSEDRQYHDLDRMLADLAEALGLVASLLLGAGAAVVEFEEPALARERDEGALRQGLAAVRTAAGLAGGPVRLSLYFGDPAPWLGELAGLGLHGVSLDLVEAPHLADRLAAEELPGTVGLGLVDARDLRLESPDSLARRLEPIARRQGDERLLLHPNTSLEYLPSDGAVRKLALLSQTKRALEGVSR